MCAFRNSLCHTSVLVSENMGTGYRGECGAPSPYKFCNEGISILRARKSRKEAERRAVPIKQVKCDTSDGTQIGFLVA